jgi:hypothetical protein
MARRVLMNAVIIVAMVLVMEVVILLIMKMSLW